MRATDLRIALFSGNYNYVRDGANQALNRLVGYLLAQGAAVRVYSPTVEHPAFEPTGDLVSVPSFAIPGREEYRFPYSIPASVRQDLADFAPNVVQIASPDFLAQKAVSWARKHDVATLASIHTRFETYLSYYHLGALEPLLTIYQRNLYRRCDAIVAPSESMADVLREERMNDRIGIWSRGVDKDLFDPARRDMAWRRSLGIADGTPVIGFVGRLVMEKGLDVFAAAIDALKARGTDFATIVVGDGPARAKFEELLPDAHFVGFQKGDDLGRAVASIDIFLNPSVTETFGNVTLEAMSCRVPVVAARATGSASLVVDGVTGRLVEPRDIAAYADALASYCEDTASRTAAGLAGEARSEDYSWDAVNQRIVDLYLELAERDR
ncbi:glycosyltransferase family 1 protein [Sphingorhabdus soli]|uniref:Glycosyltransferase family 1 protein n=1 Tax=Flavisphingopyxis soli TaxID=2601267 RepID=A0A5C6UU13_9SPHN|nr:glycosyltransferase family 1 protein [Sphingorhabdus soli]TXC74215.1 glycosyltransferase family 1 protein [Sphingorhabdus soli]